MKPPTKFPAVRHIRPTSDCNHDTLLVWYSAERQEGPFCGGTWCNGDCGFPALTMPVQDPYGNVYRDKKAHSSYVACGRVMQQFRIRDWIGAKVEVPEEYREAFGKMMWW